MMIRTKLSVVLPVAASLIVAAGPSSACGASAGIELARQLNEAFTEVAEKASPSVVVVTVVQKPLRASSDDEPSGGLDTLPREFWKYFGRPQDPHWLEPSVGKGSGVIVRDDGYILTNGHVVQDAQTIQVRLKDGRSYPAKVRGVDAKSDLAVIKIEAAGLPAARLADSDKTRVGEFAIVIGAPFDLEYSVTFGHVSAKGRSNILQGYDAAGMDQDFIQTDALMNPGNSGGPLLNLDGEVIGINTLIRGMHSGIGFAIPSNLAREVSDQLIAKGKFTRAWLGIGIRSLRDDSSWQEPIKGVTNGVVVDRILSGGPASRSDLAQGDIITAVAGTKVSTARDLRGQIRGKRIGEPVTLEVFRPDLTGHGQMIQVDVKPAEWVETAPIMASADKAGEQGLETGLGVTVHPLTPELAKQFGVGQTSGVIVISVEEKSPAGRKGIKRGDIITSINQQSVAGPSDFRRALKAADLKKGVAIKWLSAGKPRSELFKAGNE